MENLEEVPLVAGLVQRGLLKVVDVLNEDYVREMEKNLGRSGDNNSLTCYLHRHGLNQLSIGDAMLLATCLQAVKM